MGEPQGNRVITGEELIRADPKPSDLVRDRLKAGYNLPEGRTH